MVSHPHTSGDKNMTGIEFYEHFIMPLAWIMGTLALLLASKQIGR